MSKKSEVENAINAVAFIAVVGILAWMFHPMNEEVDQSGYTFTQKKLLKCPSTKEYLTELTASDDKLTSFELDDWWTDCKVEMRNDARASLQEKLNES